MPLKYGFSSPFAHFLIEAVMITYSESQNRFKKIRVSSPLKFLLLLQIIFYTSHF